MLLAELLNILENFPMKELGSNSVASIHVIAEASKRVFADRGVYFGGYPDYQVPVAGLTNKEYARSLAQTHRPDEGKRRGDVEGGRSDEVRESRYHALLDHGQRG